VSWNFEEPEYYLEMTTAELLQRQRNAEKAIRRLDKETPDWRDEEGTARNYELTMRQYKIQSAIQTELDRQKQAPGPTNPSTQGKLDAALNAWFRKQDLQLPTAINLNFSVRDRQYSARYYPDSGKLDVSIAVAPGTPGAKKQGNRYLMPCRNLDEYKAAEAAEKRQPK
jgi:hypothetical protein